MAVEYDRWYDKTDDLSQLLKFLESIDRKNRKLIANEILQIVFSELRVNANEKVNELAKLDYNCNRRWYDEDTDVQSAVEVIKNLSKNQRAELMQRLVETLEQLVIKSGEVM